MIFDLLNEKAQDAVTRYQGFLAKLQLIYVNALSNPNFASASARAMFVDHGAYEAKMFLDHEARFMETDVDDIFREAHQHAMINLQSVSADSVPALASEHLNDSLRYLFDEATAQVNRDVASLKSRLQMAMFEISTSKLSRASSFKSAQTEYRMLVSREIDFTVKDRGGRAWVSEKFYRALYRQVLLSVYNETMIIDLADHGLTKAQVYHADQKAEVDGMIIAFAPGFGLPVYSEIRDTIFHPNANAVLGMEQTDVQLQH